MTKSEFKTFIKGVPKAELHIHIEAVTSLAGVKKLYKNRFGKEMSKEEQVALFSYEDLNGFIQSFLKIQDMFVSEKDFNVVFKELEKYQVGDTVKVSFNPVSREFNGRWYTDLRAWRISGNVAAASAAPVPPPPAAEDLPAVDFGEDLPF